MNKKTLFVALLVAPLVSSMASAQTDAHAGHDMGSMAHRHGDVHASAGSKGEAAVGAGGPDAHAGHAMPAAKAGAWSYKGRQPPAPHATGRFEVVPVDKMQFVASDELSAQARCDAWRRNTHVMVDRATRAACNPPSTPAPAQGRQTTDPHAGHRH